MDATTTAYFTNPTVIREMEKNSIRMHYSTVATMTSILTTIIVLLVVGGGTALVCSLSNANGFDTLLSVVISLIVAGIACVFASYRFAAHFAQVAEDHIDAR